MLGARILTALRKRHPNLRIYGIGGPLMEEAGGFTSLFSYTELSHIGFISVLRHLPSLIQRYRQTVQCIVRNQPDVLLTIDCPDFALRVSKAVQGKTQRVHCVAPTVWAWRKNRAQQLAQQTDCLLHLFRFEADYFTHMNAMWVGHPLADDMARPIDAERFWKTYPNFFPQDPLLCVLPGSRPQEIASCWPVFQKTVEKLRERLPKLNVIVVTLPRYAKAFAEEGYTVVTEPEMKRAVFAKASAALACSGTVTLELALTRTPMVIGYVVHPLVAWILKKIVSTPYVGLVNILAGSCIAPECLQDAFNPDTLAQAIYPMLTRSHTPALEQDGLNKVWWNVKADTTFAERGADVVASFLKL